MDNSVEGQQSIHVAAEDNESYEDQADDEINAEEEINEVVEDETTDLDKSAEIEEEVEDESNEQPKPQAAGKTSLTNVSDLNSSRNTEVSSDGEAKEDGEKNNSASEASKKLLRMQLSTQTLQKLLKEGKMEKLPSGSFRISADALKELRKDSSETEEKDEADGGRGKRVVKKRKYSTTEDSEDEYSTPSKITKKKETGTKKRPTIVSKNYPKVALTDISKGKWSDNKNVKPFSMSEMKLKLKKTKFHDYVSDFNTSEEEDDEIVTTLKDSIAELAPTKPDRLTKPVSLLFEQLHNTMFGNISDDSDDADDELEEEERIKKMALAEPDFGRSDSSSIDDIPSEFWMVGRIGNDGKTKMCIRSTAKHKSWEGRQYPIYNIDTGVGSVTTVTPLMVTALRTTQNGDLSDKSLQAGVDVNLSDPDLEEKLKLKTVSLRKYKEQVKVLRRRYLQLARHVATRPQLQTIADLVGASSRFLTQDQLLFYTMQLKAGCESTQGARFSTREKLLSLALYQQHPDTYKWLHRMFNLPSTPVLERWLDTVARGHPTRVKQLMYHVYTRYCFKPTNDLLHQTVPGY